MELSHCGKEQYVKTLHPPEKARHHSSRPYQTGLDSDGKKTLSCLRTVLRIQDVYPGSWILIFTHPGSKNSNKREEGEKTCCHTFFVATNFTKLKIILFLQC
jgi:hypothetical protein